MTMTDPFEPAYPAPDDLEGWCAYYHAVDELYGTGASSPLHHDKRCPRHLATLAEAQRLLAAYYDRNREQRATRKGELAYVPHSQGRGSGSGPGSAHAQSGRYAAC